MIWRYFVKRKNVCLSRSMFKLAGSKKETETKRQMAKEQCPNKRKYKTEKCR